MLREREKCWKKVYFSFVDLEKVNDRGLNRPELWNILYEYGLDHLLLNEIRVDDDESDAYLKITRILNT